MLPSALFFASLSEATYKIGDRVLCRDEGKEWKPGTVMSTSPLKVKKDGVDMLGEGR